METLPLVLIALPFVAVAAYRLIVTDMDGLARHRGEYVAIQLDSSTIRGVLVSTHRDSVVLADAAEITQGADVSIERAVVPRARIPYVQVGATIAEDALR
jgi:hypothetical protein